MSGACSQDHTSAFDAPIDCRSGLRRHRCLAGAAKLLLVIAIWLIANDPSLASIDDLRQCGTTSGHPDRAIAACTRLLRERLGGADLAKVYYNRGVAWFSSRNYDNAIADFDKSISLEPTFAASLRSRAIAWFNKHEFDRALDDLNEAIRLEPNSAGTYSARGVTLNNKGEFKRAIADFTTALRLEPVFFTAYLNRAVARHELGDVDEAIEDFTQAIRLDPESSAGYKGRAESYLAKGLPDSAISDYQQTIRIEPDSWRGYSSRGEAWRQKGDLARALADHDRAVALDPRSSEARNNRALVLRDLGEWDAAVADCTEAIRLNPGHARAWGNRGDVWRLKGELELALADVNTAVGLAPKAPTFLRMRGEILRLKGDIARSIADFSAAIEINARDIEAYTGRGLAHESNGDIGRALADFQTTLRLTAAPVTRHAQVTARVRLDALVAGWISAPPVTERTAALRLPSGERGRAAEAIQQQQPTVKSAAQPAALHRAVWALSMGEQAYRFDELLLWLSGGLLIVALGLLLLRMTRTARQQAAVAEPADQGADAEAEHGEDTEQPRAHASAEHESAEQAEDPQQSHDRPELEPQEEMLGWWELLGVSRYAEIGEITASYRALIRQCHPDRFFGHPPEVVAEAERRAKALNLALEEAKAERASMQQADLSPFGTSA